MNDRLNQGSKALVYVAVGASDVVGEGADDPATEAWPLVLHAKLPPGTVLHCLGVAGSTAEEAIHEQLPAAESVRPDVVTVWLAVNDYRHQVALEIYCKHLDEIVRRLTATGARVVVGNLPDLSGIPELSEGKNPTRLKAQVASWNSKICEVVNAHGAILADLLEASEGFDEDMDALISEDRFHPSTLGHIALAEIFFHHIEPELR